MAYGEEQARRPYQPNGVHGKAELSRLRLTRGRVLGLTVVAAAVAQVPVKRFTLATLILLLGAQVWLGSQQFPPIRSGVVVVPLDVRVVDAKGNPVKDLPVRHVDDQGTGVHPVGR